MTEYTEIRIAAPAALSDDISAVLCEAELAFQEADQTTLDPPPPGQVRFHLFVPPPEAAGVLALLHEHLDLPPDVPYGGTKQSGYGVELGQQGVEEFTQVKIINLAK